MRSGSASISYRPIKPGEEAGVIDFVLKIFTEFVAPQYPPEGVAEFKKFVCRDALADRLTAGDIVLLAESGYKIIGVIEIRDNNHIALLFVENSFQRKGIAKELIRRSVGVCRKHKPEIQRITVNSSPNAFTAYQKIGFRTVEDEKVVNGIRFIPMELTLENQGSS